MPHPRPTQLQGITDLTVIADIKPGLVTGIFESRSYAWRLKTVLELLDAARHASREASEQPNPFIDNVGRLRGVQFFRFAVPPPGRQLFLNVTFDGGWEPYIRRIWGPLGTLLDLIFCHCEGYPLAATSTFDDYVAWIRRQEAPGLFFYADAAGTAADRSYLNRLETLQRTRGGQADADLRAAQLALEPPRPPQPGPASVNLALRNLKGLFSLTRLFGMPPPAVDGVVPEDDGSVLLRFAQDFLSDLRGWYAQGLFDPGQRYDTLRSPFEREREWLMSRRWSRPRRRELLSGPDPRAVQAGILSSPRAPEGRYTRGALVLARVRDAAGARGWLQTAATPAVGQTAATISDGMLAQLDDTSVACTVAITYPGLQALGVHQQHLDTLPAEFMQGMEARAGLLGDLRGNHPQHWKRPRAGQTGPDTGAKLAPIDLNLVHLVIQLRTAEADGDPDDDRSLLLPRLRSWMDALPSAAIEVLAVEPGWSKPSISSEPAARDHFGYVDGISQPRLAPSAHSQFWDDAVKTGEMLLGWVNDRGDGPLDVPDSEPKRSSPEWLDNGSFLVVRKIRQHVERFDTLVQRAAEKALADGLAPSIELARELVRAKLMGRGSDGQPPVAHRGAGPNDFDYRHDSTGAQCPFASHVRRANPRVVMEGNFPPPRIVRRGMAYGAPPAQPGMTANGRAERGVLFMAYNASIAEQFEVIQRWLTGGNSSGVLSAQPDPFLGVPQQGEPSVFRCTHGDKVLRIDMGDEPINSLEWGLYTFVPSMTLLQTLDAKVTERDLRNGARGSRDMPSAPTPAPAPVPAPATAPLNDEEKLALQQQVKREFEDSLTRDAGWKRVREKHAGVEKVGTTVVVGAYAPVMQVLRDNGSTYSVSGYGKRMRAAELDSPFGRDDAGDTPGHGLAHVAAMKKAIGAAVTEQDAFVTASKFVNERLARELKGAQALGLQGASIDLLDLGVRLVAHLCVQWFGVAYTPGGVEEGNIEPKARPVRCPGHFLVMARNVFSAYPNNSVKALAVAQAPALKDAVTEWVDAAEAAGTAGPPVMKAVLDAMHNLNIDDDERRGTVANVMLGLPATLLGTWAKVVVTWTGDRRLWRLQHELAQAMPAVKVDNAHTIAVPVLRHELIRTMAADPVADGIWRTAKTAAPLGRVTVEAGDIVWLGLGAALRERPNDLQTAEELLFGGALEAQAAGHAPHACPGRGLAMGALLGALAGLLLAGQWEPTASPTTLGLKPALP
ncbi:MAG: Dyp-type peroxidase [Rubrivivax sp.]|nr:Dyp-type peroxidase [Rubrivivax sp.]